MSTALQANIKRQLLEKNMSAAELERRTGIPHAVINILHGRSKNPSLKTAQAIAKELGCSVEELLGETTSTRNSSADAVWSADLYLQCCQAVCAKIPSDITPTVDAVAKCVNEAYLYSLGSAERKLDHRFIAWLVTKTF